MSTQFTLTRAYTETLFETLFSDPLTGITTYFDPSMKFIAVQEDKVYVRCPSARRLSLQNAYPLQTLQEWTQVGGTITSRLKDGKVVMVPTAIDVRASPFCVLVSELVQSRADADEEGTATQLNGKPYNNRYAKFSLNHLNTYD
ncbi:hypothetical protein R3P38DRAFT_3170195 [Favolaschia claudopus]|uniref:Uncharacterized protein n=1 Tax=Favolaschia claudopus TaxID=2862362 RepID=A0AAW0DVJ6_9AGAR